MPTIEVVSVQAIELPSVPRFTSLAIVAEAQEAIQSHRALFTTPLAALSGVILHLGDPDLDPNEPGWWASELIDWDDEGAGQSARFRFVPSARVDVEHLLDLALRASPISRAILLTDWQFGPAPGTIVKARALASLWEEHDEAGLRWNHLYELQP